MTYDARRSGGDLTSKQNLGFGAVVLGVVALVFAVVMYGPNLFSGSGAPAGVQTAEAREGDALHAAFDDRGARTYLSALRDADGELYTKLDREFARIDGNDRPAQVQALMNSSERLIERNARTLARANVAHFDAILAFGRRELKAANRSGTRYCRGAFLATLVDKDPTELEHLAESLMASEGKLFAVGVEFNTLVAEAISDARDNPVKHGALGPRDEAAMQGLAMSLMADPQIMNLMMSGQQDPEAALRQVNICTLSDTLLAALRTLPQDTKGRIWAEAMENIASGDIHKQLDQLSAF